MSFDQDDDGDTTTHTPTAEQQIQMFNARMNGQLKANSDDNRTAVKVNAIRAAGWVGVTLAGGLCAVWIASIVGAAFGH